jgi:hypothetical protein
MVIAIMLHSLLSTTSEAVIGCIFAFLLATLTGSLHSTARGTSASCYIIILLLQGEAIGIDLISSRTCIETKEDAHS